jgi:hypothetical protein
MVVTARRYVPAHRTRLVIALFIAVAVVAGCGRQRSSRSSVHQATKSEMSAAEVKFGIAPIPDATVAYQPDVIVVGGGADAVRALNPNGFIWTIDGSAPHARELAPGKIIFLTSRAVGRVIDVRGDGGNLVITVGPVAITDIIKKANIRVDMPVDFGEALTYTAPDLPGRAIPSAPRAAAARVWPDSGAAVTNVAYITESRSAGAGQAPAPASPPPVAPVPDVSSLVNFKVSPVADSSGVGLRATSDGGGMKISAQATVHLASPRLNVNLDIDDAAIKESTLELAGAAGLTLQFEAGTSVGLKANVSGRLQPDTDFSIPIIGLGPVPLAVTVRQQFIIKTALGVRDATISAVGDYTFGGSFKVGYAAGKWGVFGPLGFSAKQSMLQSAGGISIAASGLDMAHQMKVIAGVGAFGFATGPYFAFNSSVGVFKGSDLGMVKCKEATIVVSLAGGVGYFIPKPVADAFNFVLRALNIQYRINGEGGLSSDPLEIINSTSTLQGCKAGK